MAEIVITHSYYLRFDPKQWKTKQPYPPLSTLYAASVLRNHAFNIAFFDTMFCHSAQEIIEVLEKEKPSYFIICDDGFNYLNKMCLTNMRNAAFEMAAIAKSYGCKVIISSSDSTDHSMEYLQKGADIIIVGEVEQTLLELMNALKNNTDIATIDGLRFVDSGEEKVNRKRENLKNLDLIPLPAWDLIDLTKYKKMWLKKKGFFSLNLVTTRGCPYKCNWCAKPIYGNRYNSRSPENVVEELKLLIKNHEVEHIWFCDDIFGLKPSWVKQFNDLIQEENIHFRYKIQSRVDLLLEENTIESLAKSGCQEIWVGAESASQKVLDAMDKGIKVEQIYQATKLLKQWGVKPCFFLQLGYPGENKSDINDTLKMVLELMPADIGISVSYPLPGTKFYESVKSQLSHKTNWTDSDELAIMFKSPYSTQFYKKTQRLIHYQYRLKKAIDQLNVYRKEKNLLRPAFFQSAFNWIKYSFFILFVKSGINSLQE